MSDQDRNARSVDEEGQRSAPKPRRERLLSLMVAGILLFNYPVLSIFSKKSLVLGIPLLFAYLFVVWALVIGAVMLVLRDRTDQGRKQNSERSEEDR